MYRSILVFCFLVLCGRSYAQQQRYLYLDAENNQVFYVKLGGKVHSSTASGYLLLTGLNERELTLHIGFPKDIYPEQRFIIPMDNDDQGFHLINLPGKGWTLINLKTNEQIINSTPPPDVEDSAIVKRTDAFSILLSKVVNDPAVLIATPRIPETGEKTIAGVPAHPGDTSPAGTERQADLENTAMAPKDSSSNIRATDTSAIAAGPEIPELKDSTAVADTLHLAIRQSVPKEKEQEPIQKERPIIVRNPSNVLKLYDQRFEQRYEAVYVDTAEGQNDTIRISYAIMPEPVSTTDVTRQSSPEAPTRPADSVKNEMDAAKQETDSTKNETQPAKQDTTLAINNTREESRKINDRPEPTPDSDKVVLVNTDCKNFADEQDVDKLRVKILKDKEIEQKLATARKYFKTKCFTVKQIKALSELFPEDEYKYQFFELSYPFISDFANFPDLESQFMTSYYRNRFKTLIRK